MIAAGRHPSRLEGGARDGRPREAAPVPHGTRGAPSRAPRSLRAAPGTLALPGAPSPPGPRAGSRQGDAPGHAPDRSGMAPSRALPPTVEALAGVRRSTPGRGAIFGRADGVAGGGGLRSAPRPCGEPLPQPRAGG